MARPQPIQALKGRNKPWFKAHSEWGDAPSGLVSSHEREGGYSNPPPTPTIAHLACPGCRIPRVPETRALACAEMRPIHTANAPQCRVRFMSLGQASSACGLAFQLELLGGGRPGRHAALRSKTQAGIRRAMIMMPFVTCLDVIPLPPIPSAPGTGRLPRPEPCTEERHARGSEQSHRPRHPIAFLARRTIPLRAQARMASTRSLPPFNTCSSAFNTCSSAFNTCSSAFNACSSPSSPDDFPSSPIASRLCLKASPSRYLGWARTLTRRGT